MTLLGSMAVLGASICQPDAQGFIDNEEIYEVFAEQSVAIISAAKLSDLGFLETAISPDAKLVRQAHIYSTHIGPSGVIEFASWFDADSFVWRRRPYHTPAPASAFCSPIEIEIEFLPANRTYGTSIKFQFENGVLVSAQSASHKLREGQVTGSRAFE